MGYYLCLLDISYVFYPLDDFKPKEDIAYPSMNRLSQNVQSPSGKNLGGTKSRLTMLPFIRSRWLTIISGLLLRIDEGLASSTTPQATHYCMEKENYKDIEEKSKRVNTFELYN
jgi:hypothetical protein